MKNNVGHAASQNDDGSFSIVGNKNLRITREELDKLIALNGGRWIVFVDYRTPSKEGVKRISFNDAR